MTKIEISKTNIHGSRPWQVFITHPGDFRRIPLGSFKTKRAAQKKASELVA